MCIIVISGNGEIYVKRLFVISKLISKSKNFINGIF